MSLRSPEWLKKETLIRWPGFKKKPAAHGKSGEVRGRIQEGEESLGVCKGAG
jgi:hypothetical protein